MPTQNINVDVANIGGGIVVMKPIDGKMVVLASNTFDDTLGVDDTFLDDVERSGAYEPNAVLLNSNLPDVNGVVVLPRIHMYDLDMAGEQRLEAQRKIEARIRKNK